MFVIVSFFPMVWYPFMRIKYFGKKLLHVSVWWSFFVLQVFSTLGSCFDEQNAVCLCAFCFLSSQGFSDWLCLGLIIYIIEILSRATNYIWVVMTVFCICCWHLELSFAFFLVQLCGTYIYFSIFSYFLRND